MLKTVLKRLRGANEEGLPMPENQLKSSSSSTKIPNYGVEVEEVPFTEFDRRNQSQVKLPIGYERRNCRHKYQLTRK